MQSNPNDRSTKVILYSNRAQCHLNLKDYKSAEHDAASALALDGEHSKSLFRRGTALYHLKRYKEAKAAFNKLLMVDPKSKDGLSYLTHTEQKLSKIKMEAYEKLCYDEPIGDSTKIGNKVIPVQEVNVDPKLLAEKDMNRSVSAEGSEELPQRERESRTDFLSKTDVSKKLRGEEQVKGLSDFIENEEAEELKKLQEERNTTKQRRKKKDRKRERELKAAQEQAMNSESPAKETVVPSSDDAKVVELVEEVKVVELPQESKVVELPSEAQPASNSGPESDPTSEPNDSNESLHKLNFHL